MSYSDFSQQESSEKILLAKVNASRFLKGFTLHSGSVYKASFDSHVIVALEDSGVALTSVASVALIVTNSFYLDRVNGFIYVRTSDSVNPNGKTIVAIFCNFYANVPVAAPYDLNTGFEVEWVPLVKETSQFGVEIDNQIDQLGIAIDGKGSITFYNDKSYWASRFDKYYWENNAVEIYSWNRALLPTEAKLLFKGTIQAKSYSMSDVTFEVADSFFKIRQAFPLTQLGNYGTYPLVYAQTLKRQVYGKVNGLKPQNLDQLINGYYDLTGLIAITSASATQLTFNNPLVYTYFRKGDLIEIDGVGEFTILTVDSTTTLTLQTTLSSNQQTNSIGADLSVKPVSGRPYFNREWKIAGHALYEPSHSIVGVQNNRTLILDSTDGFKVGAQYYNAFIDSYFLEKTVCVQITGNLMRFNNEIGYTAVVGGTLKMCPIESVRLNQSDLRRGHSYTVDAANGDITLSTEKFIFSKKTLTGSITFTNGSDIVTGVGTKFTSEIDDLSILYPLFGNDSIELQVVSIIDDTNLKISANYSGATATYTDSEARKVKYFTETDVLSCDVYGATDDGLTTGALLSRGPEIVADVLTKAGLGAELNTASFASESDIANYTVGLVIPSESNDRKAPTIKEVINQINRSIFGVVIQNDSFELEYHVIRPVKTANITRFIERDVLGFDITTDSSDIVKLVLINYNAQEYNSSARERTFDVFEAESKRGLYLAKSDKTFELDTVLTNLADAKIIASRLAFYLSFARMSIDMKTKLQGAGLYVSNIMRLDHRLIFERIGMAEKLKLAQVMRIEKNATDVSIELDDLGNSFSSVANFTDNVVNSYSDATLDEKLINGYFTDSYGMQGNDPETFGTNLYW